MPKMLIFRDCIARVLEVETNEEGTVTKYFFSRVKNEVQATELFQAKNILNPGDVVRYSGSSNQNRPISTLWEIFTPNSNV